MNPIHTTRRNSAQLLAHAGMTIFGLVLAVLVLAVIARAEPPPPTARMIADLNTVDVGYDPYVLAYQGNRVLFTAGEDDRSPSWHSLWMSDSTGTAERILDMRDRFGVDRTPALSSPWGTLFIANSGLRAEAYNRDLDTIWSTDGTALGTRIINPAVRQAAQLVAVIGTRVLYKRNRPSHFLSGHLSSAPLSGGPVEDVLDAQGNAIAFGRCIGFAPSSGVVLLERRTASGFEVWRTDGTRSGSWMIATHSSGSLTSPGMEIACPIVTPNRRFNYTAQVAATTELWSSDGTATGTTRLLVLPETLAHSLYQLPDQLLLFAHFADRTDLYRSNDTATGTQLVTSLPPETRQLETANRFTVLEDELYFTQYGANGARSEVWRTNGTAAGTNRAFASDTASLRAMRAFNGTLWIRRIEAQQHCLVQRNISSGTEQTVRCFSHDEVIEEAQGTRTSSGPITALAVSGEVRNGSLGDGRRLWVSDGTSGGTLPIQIPIERSRGSFSESADDELLFEFGDKLYLRPNTRAGLLQPYVSDLTAAGTLPLFPERNFLNPQATIMVRTANGMLWGIKHTEPATGTRRQTFFLQRTPSAPIEEISLGIPTWMTVNLQADDVAVRENRMTFPVYDSVQGATILYAKNLETGEPAVSVLTLPDFAASAIITVRHGFAITGTTINSQAREVWTSDGTLTGTRRIVSRPPGTQAPRLVLQNAHYAYLEICENGGLTCTKVITDGSTAGTESRDGVVEGGVTDRTILGDILYTFVKANGSEQPTVVARNLQTHTEQRRSLGSEFDFRGNGRGSPVVLNGRFIGYGAKLNQAGNTITSLAVVAFDTTTHQLTVLHTYGDDPMASVGEFGGCAMLAGGVYCLIDDSGHWRLLRTDGSGAGTMDLGLDSERGVGGNRLTRVGTKLVYTSIDSHRGSEPWVVTLNDRYAVAGRVGSGATGLSNVTITTTPLGNGVTNADGQFNLGFVPYGTNVDILPVRTGYTFSPPRFQAPLTNANAINFDVEKAVLSGYVFRTGTTTPLSDVSITVSRVSDGAVLGSASSNAQGLYVVPLIRIGEQIRISPHLNGYQFAPSSSLTQMVLHRRIDLYGEQGSQSSSSSSSSSGGSSSSSSTSASSASSSSASSSAQSSDSSSMRSSSRSSEASSSQSSLSSNHSSSSQSSSSSSSASSGESSSDTSSSRSSSSSSTSSESSLGSSSSSEDCSLDADLDGVRDCLDRCRFDPAKVEPGTCGCGLPDADYDENGLADCSEDRAPSCQRDTDSDGTADCRDACPVNPFKTLSDLCGCNRVDREVTNGGTIFCADVIEQERTAPPAPKIRKRGNKLRIRAARGVPGTEYAFRIAQYRMGTARVKSRMRRSRKPRVAIRLVRPGTTVVASYRYFQGGAPASMESQLTYFKRRARR